MATEGHTPLVGRPSLEVDLDVLAYYVDHCFTVKQISHMMGVSVRTVERRLQMCDLSIRDQYSAVCDAELLSFVAPLLHGNPQLDSSFCNYRHINCHILRSNSPLRSDKGTENVDVAMYMLERRGVGRGSFITGKSVHNTRIERLWRDVFDQCTGPFYNLFWELERINALNPDSDVDLFALHYVFMPVLTKEIAAFRESWNHHGLRTESGQTPLQLFIAGLETGTQTDNVTSDFTDVGVEESDGESDGDEPDITHMPVTHNPLNDLQNAELHLRFPHLDSNDFNVRKDYYIRVRNFILSCNTNI